MTDIATELAAIRAEIDALDDNLRALLARRWQIVQRVGHLKKAHQAPIIRPGREALMMRRLMALDETKTGYPKAVLLQLWRLLINATLRLEGNLQVAVVDELTAALARDHFGALVPQPRLPSPAAALDAVAAGTYLAACLPYPLGAGDSWGRDVRLGTSLQVIDCLPFLPVANPVPGRALVVSPALPEATGSDRTLLRLPHPPVTLPPNAMMVSLGDVFWLDVAGFRDDPVVASIGGVIIGGYAVGLGDNV